LPTHFSLGVQALANTDGIYGWMPQSKIPWDYSSQYINGGVTGNGWDQWSTNGKFVTDYATDATAAGYIPFLSYYNMLESTGPTCSDCGEDKRDLTNLNDPTLMNKYFSNFALAMKRLGPGTYDGVKGFGKTVIIHVEPDLSGYANRAVLDNARSCFGFCSQQGNNPSYLKAAVKRSGNTDVASYPDTYQGFNWALLHLRDLYAPNVILAFHVSTWATGRDISTESDPGLDPVAMGKQAGQFAAQSGITGVPAGTSTFDLLVHDVSDADAGYFQYGKSNPETDHWWDRLNQAYPNFHRWEAYARAITQATGRGMIVWQIPEGNQYFQSLNNTDGHYQDNRAEYFFGHVDELANAGIIGLIFGSGNADKGGATVHWDGMRDGITNPSPICTSDGLTPGSEQTICNDHPSAYADDDGGYIRIQAQQYYQKPYPLSTTSG
jgi:hypothetical protein